MLVRIKWAEMNSGPAYSKDALLLGELSSSECPEVDMGFPTGDDVGGVTGVKIHCKHSLIGALQTKQDRVKIHIKTIIIYKSSNAHILIYYNTGFKKRRNTYSLHWIK